MKLNVEYINQFATFGAILAGFSMSIAYSVILHKDGSKETISKLMHFIGGAFLTSAVSLVLGGFLAALVLSVHSANGQPDPASPIVLNGADLSFAITLIGLISMLVGIGASGYIKTKHFGRFTKYLAMLTGAGAIIIFIMYVCNPWV